MMQNFPQYLTSIYFNGVDSLAWFCKAELTYHLRTTLQKKKTKYKISGNFQQQTNQTDMKKKLETCRNVKKDWNLNNDLMNKFLISWTFLAPILSVQKKGMVYSNSMAS